VTAPRPGRILLTVAMAALLALATPPSPVAALLVVPAWMAFYALLTARARPWAIAYGIGVLHMLLLSWSLVHVLWFGWLAIGLIGGGYYAWAVVVTVRLRPWLGPWAFALAVSGMHLLRAVMPELSYPHGQPCHALWQQPWLLGSVRWGGEVLANALLAALAAAIVDLWRSWRLASLPWRQTQGHLLAVLLLLAVATFVPPPAAALRADAEPPVRVLVIEPGLHPTDPYRGLQDRQQMQALYLANWRARLLQPTRELAGVGVQSPPDLVLWPESSMIEEVQPGPPPSFPYCEGIDLAPSVRLCIGAGVRDAAGKHHMPAAVLLSAQGRYLDHQEKVHLVAAGEYVPFLDLLPESVADWLRAGVESAMGDVPDSVPGSVRPPLLTQAGVPFGTLHCFDNAFPDVARAQVQQGARFLCVLSNEAWYRGGGELEQLVAMTVIRALETATPVVRCTTDGLSLLVDGSGRITATLPAAPAPQPHARWLLFSVPLGPGGLGPMAWLPLALVWNAGAMFVLAGAHSLLLWARLHAVRANPANRSGRPLPAAPRRGGA